MPDNPCELVICARLSRPHHEDTHFNEDRSQGMACIMPKPSPFINYPCWQCEDKANEVSS
jgi:hypothetical protein